jgi:hypothetical protein
MNNYGSSPPRFWRAQESRASNVEPARRRSSFSISPPPMRRSYNDRVFYEAPQDPATRTNEHRIASDIYRPGSESYRYAGDSYRPSNFSHKRTQSWDFNRPSTNDGWPEQYKASSMTRRSLPSHNAVDDNTVPHGNLALSWEKWDDSAQRPGLKRATTTVTSPTIATQFDDDPFFAKVPKGPAAFQASNGVLPNIPRGPASRNFADTARMRRTSGLSWPFHEVGLEEGREPSDDARSSPHLLVTLHDLLKERNAWWQLSLLINFHNFLMASRHHVGPITKYYLNPETVYVFSDQTVLENVDRVCRKELLFRQYRMDTNHPEMPLHHITPMKDSTSRSWQQEKTKDSRRVSSLTLPPTQEERNWQYDHLDTSNSEQLFSTTPPYSPTAPTLNLIFGTSSHKIPKVALSSSDFGSYDKFIPSPPNPASEISSMRSIKELQCAKCKSAATGVDPLIRCSRCKRKYHDSCRNLMNLSTTQGSIWNCQHCATKHSRKTNNSDRPSNLIDKIPNGALTRSSPTGSVSALSANGTPSTFNETRNNLIPTPGGNAFAAPPNQPRDLQVDLNAHNDQRPPVFVAPPHGIEGYGEDSDISMDMSETSEQLATLTSPQRLVTSTPSIKMLGSCLEEQGELVHTKGKTKAIQVPPDTSTLPPLGPGNLDIYTQSLYHDRHPTVQALVHDPLLNDRFDMVLQSFYYTDYELEVKDSREDRALAVYYFEKISTKDPALSPWNFVKPQYNPEVWDLKLLSALAELVSCFSDTWTGTLDKDRMLIHLKQFFLSKEGNEASSSAVQASFLTASDVEQVILAEFARMKQEDQSLPMQETKSEPQGRLTIRKCDICKTKQLFGVASACVSCLERHRQQSDVILAPQSSSTITAPEDYKHAQTDTLKWMFKKDPHRGQIRKVVTKRQTHDRGGNDGGARLDPSFSQEHITGNGSVVLSGPAEASINTFTSTATATIVNATLDSVTYVSPYANNPAGESQLYLAAVSPNTAASTDQVQNQVEVSDKPSQTRTARFPCADSAMGIVEPALYSDPLLRVQVQSRLDSLFEGADYDVLSIPPDKLQETAEAVSWLERQQLIQNERLSVRDNIGTRDDSSIDYSTPCNGKDAIQSYQEYGATPVQLFDAETLKTDTRLSSPDISLMGRQNDGGASYCSARVSLEEEPPKPFATVHTPLETTVEEVDKDAIPDNATNSTPPLPGIPPENTVQVKIRLGRIKRSVSMNSDSNLTDIRELGAAMRTPDEAAIARRTTSAKQPTNSSWLPSYRTLVSLALNRDPKKKTAREIADWIIQNVPNALSVREESVWVSSVSAVCSMACSSSRPYLRKLETSGPNRRCTYYLNNPVNLALYEAQFRQNIGPNPGADVPPDLSPFHRSTSSVFAEKKQTPKGIKRSADDTPSEKRQRPKKKARKMAVSEPSMKNLLIASSTAGASPKDGLIFDNPSQSQADSRLEARSIADSDQIPAEMMITTLAQSGLNVSRSKTGAAWFGLPTSPGPIDDDTEMPDPSPISDDDEEQMSDVDVVPTTQQGKHAKEWEDPLDVLFEPMRQDEIELLDFLKTDPVMSKPNYTIKDLFAVHPELRPKPQPESDSVPEKPRRLRRKEIIGTPYRNPAREYFIISERIQDSMQAETVPNNFTPTKRTRPSPSKKSRYEWDLHAHNTNLSETDLYDSISQSARIKCSSLEEAAGIPRIAVMDLDARGNLIFRDGEQIVSRIQYSAGLVQLLTSCRKLEFAEGNKLSLRLAHHHQINGVTYWDLH